MNYKEKYNKLVEAVKKLQEANPSDEDFQNWVNDNVPELKWNDDEKIRKGLIGFLRNIPNHNYTCEEMALWLEKQGEQKLNGTFVNVDDVREDFIDEVYRVLDADFTTDRANQIIDAFDNLPTVTIEKQGAQPRYNIGDVICDLSCNEYDENAQLCYEIIDIKNGMYICSNGSIPVSQQDEYRLVAKKGEQKSVNRVNNDEDSVSNELREASFIFAATQMVHKASPEERKLELIYTFEEGAKWQAAQKSQWKPSDEQMDALEYHLKHTNEHKSCTTDE